MDLCRGSKVLGWCMDEVEAVVLIRALHTAQHLNRRAIGLQLAEQPVFGVVVGAEHVEAGMSCQESLIGLNVAGQVKELCLEGHAFKDGGVGKGERGIGVGQVHGAMQQAGRLAALHFEKGEPRGGDEGQLRVSQQRCGQKRDPGFCMAKDVALCDGEEGIGQSSCDGE